MTEQMGPNLRLADRYTLREKLGSGGQGEVWRAFDAWHDAEVALKILSRAFAPTGDPWLMLQREYRVTSELDHPLILKVYAPVCAGLLALLPMQLATGGDLRLLRGASYLEILPVLIDLARALAYAHERGVVHRDLKPANVLFDGLGRVLLADFGVAGRAAPQPLRIDQGCADWSPSSASPQQLRGLPPAPGDDIYGLGALTFELLTGRPAYFPQFAVRRVLHEPVPAIEPVHRVPLPLLGLVRSMLAKDPRHRPQSMERVIVGLEAALDEPFTREYRALGANARELAAAAPPRVAAT